MRIICVKQEIEPARAAQLGTDRGSGDRGPAIDAFKHAIDALFEAESAERAIPTVRRLFVIAHRPALGLAALQDYPFPPRFAASLGAAGTVSREARIARLRDGAAASLVSPSLAEGDQRCRPAAG
jgi:hypothetical protein